jgi:hypothetical protein
MSETATLEKYNVIIDSVGKAAPSASKVLAEGLSLPIEIISKAIYNAPAVLFRDVEERLAKEAEQLLIKLGMEVSVKKSTEPLPEQNETCEIAVYVENIAALPVVCNQLAAFLGCESKEALSLLISDPCIVLGGVSHATAMALSKRIDAEVIISNPKSDLYTLEMLTQDKMVEAQLIDFLNAAGFQFTGNKKQIENIPYAFAQELWRRFQYNNSIKIVNQSFQRFEIVLEKIDTTIANYKKALTTFTGMPHDIVDDVIANLPIQLDESVNRNNVPEKIEAYKNAGLICEAYLIPNQPCSIYIQHIEQLDKTQQILMQFFDRQSLATLAGGWKSAKPISTLLARYASQQLQAVGCEVELVIE